MKLWVDDERTPPDDTWVWSKTVANALDTLRLARPGEITVMSLDYCLDDGDATDILYWLKECPEQWPHSVIAHSGSSSGCALIERLVHDFQPR